MVFSWTKLLLPAALAASLCEAATRTYNWNVTWVEANPLGDSKRSVMGINGQWPLPQIVVNKGDQLVLNVYNGLGNVTTSIHVHGMFQNGTSEMDGPVGVNQCAIPPGKSFTYNFTIDQPGTYWYHSHVKSQYPDGLRGVLLVEDPDMPYKDMYDAEMSLSMSDWYNDMTTDLLKSFISYQNPTGAEPIPNGALLNDTTDLKVDVQPGKTYLFRIVNIGAFAGQYFWIEGHTMKIVEVDGVYTEPMEADLLYITVAQRYSVLVTMKNTTNANFAMVGAMDTDMFDFVPNGLNTNSTGYLVYGNGNKNPTPKMLDEYKPFDDFTLAPQDGLAAFKKADNTITLGMDFTNLGDGANYAIFNDVSYVTPKVPSLYTAMTSGNTATNAAIYGGNTNAFVLKKGDVVDIVLNNYDVGKHPFHLHGHNFQVIARSDENAGVYANNITTPAKPMRRDTIYVRGSGYMVLRFVADNPGVWLFHCHIEWHVASGLVATMIEDPIGMQSKLSIPQEHYAVCKDQDIPIAGNAAGNTKNLLDLTGENKAVEPLPAGFTARGIVALVFSCIAAFCGMGVIIWYGRAPIAPGQQAAMVNSQVGVMAPATTHSTGFSNSDDITAAR